MGLTRLEQVTKTINKGEIIYETLPRYSSGFYVFGFGRLRCGERPRARESRIKGRQESRLRGRADNA